MKDNMKRWIRVSAIVAVVAALVAVTAIALSGATSEEDTITAEDTAQMRQYLNEFWTAIQVTWPEEYRGGNQKKLPDGLKASWLASSKPVIERVTTGRVYAHYKTFNPGGFVELLRDSGSVVTDSGYEIVTMGEPELVSVDTAEVEVTVRSWNDEYVVDEDGKAKGKPYKIVNDLEYRYTFKKIGGFWRISSERLLNSPV